MPQQINVPGQGVIEFPDSMSDDQIKGVIKRKFYTEPLSFAVNAPGQITQTLTAVLSAGAEGSAMGREQLQTMRAAINTAVDAPLEATRKVSQALSVGVSRDEQIDEEAFLKAIGQEGQPPQNALIRAARNWQMAGMATQPNNVTVADVGGTKITSGEGVQLPTVQPPPEAGVTEKVAAGLWNVGVSIPNFALSLQGLTTMLAPELLPVKYAEPLLKGIFAGLLAKATGEAAGKASVTHDPQDITEAVGSAVMTGLLGYSGAIKALDERRQVLGMDPVKPPIKDLIKTLIDKVRPAEVQAVAPATTEALKGVTEDAIHKQATEVLQPVREQPGESKGEVSTQGAGTETGTRGESVGTEETQAVKDSRRYTELVQQVRGKSLDEAAEINQELEDIKSRYGGFPPPDSQEESVQPALGPKEGMGGAKVGEIPDTGTGGEKYGISQRVREERAQAGQVDPVLPGEGVSVETSIERGNQINTQEPEFVGARMTQFEADPEKNISDKFIAAARARGHQLALIARRAEEQFGTSSPEYQTAKDALSDWDRRTKPLQTEWAKQGQAQQSWTDLDTGSVAGLEREHTRLTDGAFDEDQKVQAGKFAKDVRDKEAETTTAATAVNEELQNNASPERQHENDKQQVADATKAANEAADRVDEAEKKIQDSQDIIDATRRALDAASKTVRDSAARVAEAENKARVAQAQRDLDVAKLQRKAAQKAQDAATRVVRQKAIQAAKSERAVQERQKLDDQDKAARAALDAAAKTVRDAAARRAEAENKARVAQAVRDKQVHDIAVKAARAAEDAAWKVLRDASKRQAETERKILADLAIPVWEKARKYLDAGFVRFDDLRAKIASDLGMTTEQVTRLLARSKRMKFLTDDLWLKQQRERNAKTKAKLWVHGLDMPAYEKFINSIPRALFKIRVGFHGTVALGTHAPAVAFDPRFWGTYVRNFGKMYKLVLSPSFYEGQMQDLMRRKNYATALRSGLVVDPYKYEEFDRPGISTDVGRKIDEAMTKALSFDRTAFTKSGERGYSILKVLRQDMFDQHWDNLPRQMQTTEVAKAISKAVNHITGVVNVAAPAGADLLLFAPKLQLSRGAFLFADPIQAARTGVKIGVRAVGGKLGVKRSSLPFVTPAERYFAANEVKTKAYTVGTLASLLALNQGILVASGSSQQVNMTDPFKHDFAKFKGFDKTVSYSNPLITMARMPLRLATLAMGPGGKLRKLVYPDEDAMRMVGEYFRSQFSPAAALVADLLFREDWQRRQIDFGPYGSQRPEPKRLLAQGIEPYTPAEYWTQQALPIPFQELFRESLHDGFGVGPTLSTLFMAMTGGRVSNDPEVEHPQ